MGLTVVHRAAPEVVPDVVARFQDEGVDAVAIDEPNFLALLFAFGTYRVRVAVPDEQLERAHELMDEWARSSEVMMRGLEGELRGQLGKAALVAAAVAVPCLVFLRGWSLVPAFACAVPATFLLAFLAISLVARAREGRRGRGGSAGDEADRPTAPPVDPGE